MGRIDAPSLASRHEQFLGKGAFRAAASNIAGRFHRIDDDRVADGDSFNFGADLQDFSCCLVPERGHRARRNASHLDVAEVAPANTTGLHPYDYVFGPSIGSFIRIEADIAGTMDLQQTHSLSPPTQNVRFCCYTEKFLLCSSAALPTALSTTQWSDRRQ